ncbi:carbohydrate ABC transporter permease [Deinococcus peraridilitoris]|uniref:ABC-type sugar transport system, permease component n=1 Tax=Deinococcus peraridilitoris (strain DSM 19664 / LMG 22246 / CIP 109416 / KR-200) TaxID=937777 RepID=L0A6C9_DEIPD|nr:carbohydrate ABC transporter permease [Deinococcus peraridilitoris]AFZ68570.1 ABC-type sugar transport system, permease component [Deinococcus peraridilitoris DSM 19664]
MAAKTMRATPLKLFFIHATLIMAILLIASPLLFALIKATQASNDVISPRLIPGGDFINNVRSVWTDANLGRYMINSLIVATSVTIGKTLLSVLAALAFVYFRFPLKSLAFALVLFTLMLPTELLIVALFDLVGQTLGWANSYLAIIVPFLASATGTFLFRQHFMSIPDSLADAARIDGCGPLRFLWHVLIPMSTNTIGALAVIQFVFVWDQYLWPLVIMQNDEKQVVQVGLRKLIDVGGQTDWGAVMAGAIVTIIPPLLIFTLLQEQFSKGFALSQDK